MKNLLLGATCFFSLSASAAMVDYGTYFQDTATGLYWLKLTETRNISYDDVTAQLAPGQPLNGWRFATLAEVENLIAANGFPNQGRDCGDGWGNYCDTVPAANAELFEDLIRLLGDTLDAGFDAENFTNDVAPDGAGAAYGMLGQRGDPGGSFYYHVYEAQLNDSQMVVRETGAPAFDQQDTIRIRPNTASAYGSSTAGSFLVRTTDPTVALDDPNDPNTLEVTLFDSLSPNNMGLSASLYCEQPGFYFPLCLYNAESWSAMGAQDYTGSYYYGEFILQNISFDQEARPWMRIAGYDYKNGSACDAGDTDLGDGWCRKDTSSAAFRLLPPPETASTPYQPPTGTIAGTLIDKGDSFQLDNVELEFINSNIRIDFDSNNSANTIRPKEAYFVPVAVKTLSVADGDPVDFDPTQIDPATVKFGPARAPNVALPLRLDVDGDGDLDSVFGFRVENSGVGCLDTSVTLVAQTYSGEPLAGQDSVTPINCEELIDIDVDPFNSTNIIRPNDSYNVTVAFLGMRTADGDAVDVRPGTGGADDIDVSTLKFGPAETGATTAPVITDIDGDSNDDLLITFNAYDAGIACEDTELGVTGTKVSGIPVEAVDSIVTEDCSTASCHP